MLVSTLAATIFGSIVASAVPASVPTGTGHTCPSKELWSCSTAALSSSADGCCVGTDDIFYFVNLCTPSELQ